MLQLINKKKIYFYLASFLFISTIFNHNLIKNLKNTFKINTIKIENNKKSIDDIILSNTNFLIEKNIFFVNKKILSEKMYNLNFIENINIKKKYPSTINIKSKITDLIAITYIDQKKYFVGQNGNLILMENILNEKKLPIIFGKFNPSDYIIFRKELLNQQIELNEIVRYYFHKNKRWDIYFKNNILIKLPQKNISQAIKLYKNFINMNEVEQNTTIDLRVAGRLILNNG